MKPLKITTRETDKLRDRIKVLDTSIDNTEKFSTHGSYAVRDLDATKALRLTVVSTLSALIDAKTAAIVAALANVNGRAEAHTISTYADVWAVADRAEVLLDRRGVSKKNRVGATIIHHPSGPSASAYKYGVVSTDITLKRVADGWRLVGVNRYKQWPRSLELFSLTISPSAADDISRTAFDGITIRTVAEAAA